MTFLHDRVTLPRLRKELPQFAWTANRSGWSWRYQGLSKSRTVAVRSEAALVGPGDEDYEVRWVVEEGNSAMTYAAFWFKERPRP